MLNTRGLKGHYRPPEYNKYFRFKLHFLSPFHNWRTTTLQHFAIEIF